MENGTVFTIKPTKETKSHRLLEFLYVASYHDGVMFGSQFKRKIGEKLGLLLNFMENWSDCWRYMRASHRKMKKELESLTKEQWEEAREEWRQDQEKGDRIDRVAD